MFVESAFHRKKKTRSGTGCHYTLSSPVAECARKVTKIYQHLPSVKWRISTWDRLHETKPAIYNVNTYTISFYLSSGVFFSAAVPWGKEKKTWSQARIMGQIRSVHFTWSQWTCLDTLIKFLYMEVFNNWSRQLDQFFASFIELFIS